MPATPFTIAARNARTVQGSPTLAARITTEGRVVGKLVSAALAAGYVVSVFDGEEWVGKKLSKKTAIMALLFSTDEDQLVLRDAKGEKVGWFQLIYGNDGYDVISDYSDNEVCNALNAAALVGEAG